jgi:hypothetical protein
VELGQLQQVAGDSAAGGVDAGVLPPPRQEQHLFELHVQAVLATQTTGHGDPDPHHTIWRAG